MLNNLSEKKMHIVKWTLAIGWSLMIISLFYDPITPILTEPTNLSSPFRINLNDACIKVQNVCLPDEVYSMTARIFWAMIVPAGLVIIFVFGHEVWRRICPLSFFSQIPRALGIQRPQKVAEDSWLGRNHLYLQIAFFFAGLNIRILFVNSDRMALAVFLIFTILSAITVGYLFAGKSWCQYFCPMAPVQMVYTGPRGLLDSQAHVGEKLDITQSMCREVDKITGKEKSACVACQNPCIDVDSEKAYWEKIESPDRKLLYFGYVGLVIGFYAYYFLYSGNWEYYYSGAWTHEEGQLSNILSSGLYLGGQTIGIPKLLATPLVLAAFFGGAYAIGRIGENIYRKYLKKTGNNLPNDLILHRIFTVCTVVAWNIFWVFGSRPNLAILPEWIERIFTAIIITVSAFWFTQTFWRTSEQYSREGFAITFRRQLSKLGIDMAKILKRNVEDLKPDEVYVLAKVLPEITRDQKDRVYRGVLLEALEDGMISTAEDKLLSELRVELGIDIDQHYTILASLGIEDPSIFDPDGINTRENKLRLDSYQKNLEFLIFDLVEAGVPVNKALSQKAERVISLKKEYAITEEEDDLIISKVLGEEGNLVKNSRLLLSKLEALNLDIQGINNLSFDPSNSVCRLLKQIWIDRQKSIAKNLLGILEVLGSSPEALQISGSLNKLAYLLVNELLDKRNDQDAWLQRLDDRLIKILTIESSKTVLIQNKSQISRFVYEPFISLLQRFIHEDVEPLVKALSLQEIRLLDVNLAKQIAKELKKDGIDAESILSETVESMLKESNHLETLMSLIVEIAMEENRERRVVRRHSVFQRSPLHIGNDYSNDIIIPSQSVMSHHAIIHFNESEASIQSVDNQAQIYIGDRDISNSRYILKKGDRIRFSLDQDASICFNWEMLPEQNLSKTDNLSTLDKMLYLFESNFFSQIEINSLIELARYSQMETYQQGDMICDIGDPSDRLFIILDGWVNAIVRGEDGAEQIVNRCFKGETIGELGVLTHSTRSARLVVASTEAHILSLSDRDIDFLLARNPILSYSLLTIVSNRLRKEIHRN